MSEQRYLIPANPVRCETEVNRSRFIASIEMTASPEAAHDFIARIKQEFPDANHNCWAYLIGPPGSTDRIGLSDDGEPHGVAGKPMLTTLQHSDIGDISVVVTRYFGGIKLGKGGMVKAYTLAVQNALKQLETAEKIAWLHLSLHFAYPLLKAIELILPDYEAISLSTDYSDEISLCVKVPEEQYPKFRQRVTDLCAGQLRFEGDLPLTN